MSSNIEWNKLSHREADVYLLLVQGKTNQEIALDLGIQHSTVKRHVSNILLKFCTDNRVKLTADAFIKEVVKKDASTGEYKVNPSYITGRKHRIRKRRFREKHSS